jgi:hypothetical protein
MNRFINYCTFMGTLLAACVTLTILPIALFLNGFSEGMIIGIVLGLLFLETNTCFWLASQ